MDPEFILLILLALQAIIGGLDTLLNHELLEKLPYRPEAARELGMHWIREGNYGLLFLGLAWLRWEGTAAWVILALLAAEVAITARDEILENQTRILPHNERFLHVLLTLNLGLIIAAYVMLMSGRLGQPAAIAPAAHGPLSWLLSAFAAASLCWSARDLSAVRRLRRERVRQ